MATFDHVHIYAHDLLRSLAFYTGVLGAEEVGRIPTTRGFNHILLLGGQFLAVSEFPEGLSPAEPAGVADGALRVGFGVAHLGINVPDLDALLPQLEAAGVTLHSEPRGGEPIRYVYFTAPDGVVIELTQYNVPAHLQPAIEALALFHRGVHVAKRFIGKRLLAAAS
jgi:catechol 2,3-dioxygenase-like lactoylglutathione lyase family enzyme